MVFRQDVSKPEGPVVLEDGSWVVTEMNRGIISHISADGSHSRKIAYTGRPNGLALDARGDLWVAESKYPTLLKVTMEGHIATISKGMPELPFLWPNDLCFGPDGAIYLTDSGVFLDEMKGVHAPEMAYKIPIDGKVFRVDPQTGKCDLIDRGIQFTNGIAFDPQGQYLFVNETLTGNIYRYRYIDGKVFGQRELFGNVMQKPPIEHGRVAGPDGMAFDVQGNLYVAVLIEGNITVLDTTGMVKQRMEIDGTFPTNVAFDRPGKKRILITEGSKNQLLMLETEEDGCFLYKGD